MAAATHISNTMPSPASSHSSSPRSRSAHLTPPTNAPIFSQEDVLRFVQAALAAAYREQISHGRPGHSLIGSQFQTQSHQEERIMKPRLHMYESFSSPRSMVATLELPGLQKSDVAITARPNGELVIAGERKPQHLQYLMCMQGTHEGMEGEWNGDEQRGRTVFNELKFGKFQRVIRLPDGTDPTCITASMDDGMLTICWPLPVPPPSPRTSESPIKLEGGQTEDANRGDADLSRSNVRSA